METKKKLAIEATSIISVIMAYLSLVNAGIFNGIEYIAVWTYTVPQLIFLILLFLGAGLIIGDLVTGNKSKDEVSSNLKDLLGQSLGISDKELDRLKKDVTKHYKEKAMNVVKVNSVSSRSDVLNFTKPEYKYPTVTELRSIIIQKLGELMPSSAVSLATPTEEIRKGGIVSVIESKSASIEYLLSEEKYLKQKIIITCLFALVAAVMFIVMKTTQGGI